MYPHPPLPLKSSFIRDPISKCNITVSLYKINNIVENILIHYYCMVVS